MNYIIICCVCLIFIHFCLYYLNIDIFKLSNNTMSNDNTMSNNNTMSTKIDVIDIEESINQLKNLNNYIDNGPKNTTLC
jgi:hypothetical protein